MVRAVGTHGRGLKGSVLDRRLGRAPERAPAASFLAVFGRVLVRTERDSDASNRPAGVDDDSAIVERVGNSF